MSFLSPCTNRYGFERSDRLPFEVSWTPKGKSQKRVVYGIFDTVTGQMAYVGKTGQKLSQRVSWYQCMVNKIARDSEAEVEKKELIQAIANEPDRYYFTILDKATDQDSLSDLEKQFISEHEPKYNSNRGGGGGSTADSPSRPAKKRRRVETELFTPEKNYPIDNISPAAAKMRCVIYRIREISTGKRYIGKTEMSFSQRMSSHRHLAKAFKGSEIHEKLRSSPENFDVGILYACDPDEDIDFIETQFIDFYREQGIAFNKRRGGGGSHASKKLDYDLS